MLDELEALGADEKLLRICNLSQRLTAINVHTCSQSLDKQASLEEIMHEFDYYLGINEDHENPAKYQMQCQMQVMNALFHQLIAKSSQDTPKSVELIRAAFAAQKLYCETARKMDELKRPFPKGYTKHL
ncbi:MAG: hypothetical protein DI586_05975 [Micavibrio aeruginosavorus]|uniref:Uncharacterized protein n=1 Tax=Micavibrio aeruginosavorus TaxID=349221 RepID=A0A2W5HC57_9BACT|nr:MAG: hypothetical protein DI586_05975 [Micavibrio aeruginosavorus]